MGSPFLSRNSVILGKVESAYGTDPSPVVGDDAILANVPSVNLNSNLLERINVQGDLSPNQPIVGRKLWEVGFGVEFKSQSEILPGASSAPLQLDAILRCSGFDPSYTAETSGGANDGYVEYAPVSTSFESTTFYFYPGKEVLHKLTGGFCDWSIEMEAGGYAQMNVDVTGIYNEPTDSTAGAPTYESNVPVPIESISLDFGAITGMVVRNLSIALNNEIVERPDVNSAEGLKGLRIASRRPTMNFRVEKPTVSDWNIYNALDVGTTYNTTFTIGSADGQKIDVTIPVLTITSISESEDAGIVMLDVEALCARSSGNDELEFKFY